MKVNKGSSYIAPRLLGFAEFLSLRVRRKIYNDVMRIVQPNIKTNVLDIGVTCDQSVDSNFFEEYYPYKNKITALGLEDAFFLEKKYKGLKFIKGNACNLPFEDDKFDLAFCSAVIEHVGCQKNQISLILEAARVAKVVVITTPNRFYPLEFHTLTLFLHWLPKPFFRFYLKITGRNFFSKEENLNLLSDKELEAMIFNLGFKYKKLHQNLFGFTSNLVYFIFSKNN